VIIVDRALEQRERDGNPIRVGLVGAGFMARGTALQFLTAARGMELVAIANRNPERARAAWEFAGVDDARTAAGARDVDEAAAAGRHVYTDDPYALTEASGLDAIVEITGAVEFAAGVAVSAIEHGKHFVTMNAELDGTVGPALKRRADAASLIYTVTDGDQPGVTMNLYRFVRSIGVRPALCGNIKGLHDPHRTPTTQRGFAEQWGQDPQMVTSFADGTKISFEQAIIANATGMRVARRGMFGPTVEPGTPLEQVVPLFPSEALEQGPGIVDYVVGAAPAPGVFIVGTHDDPRQQHYLKLYKLGDGPHYLFYTPYHLCHFEIPLTVGRAVCLGDATLAADEIRVEVVTAAKVDLAPGDVIDGFGGYLSYGLAENAATATAERLLPIGLAEGCTVVRAVSADAVVHLDDVELPPGRLVDQLRAEQSPGATDQIQARS
jgi:predicted homoserine dehydrogenase-like protein